MNSFCVAHGQVQTGIRLFTFAGKLCLAGTALKSQLIVHLFIFSYYNETNRKDV